MVDDLSEFVHDFVGSTVDLIPPIMQSPANKVEVAFFFEEVYLPRESLVSSIKLIL